MCNYVLLVAFIAGKAARHPAPATCKTTVTGHPTSPLPLGLSPTARTDLGIPIESDSPNSVSDLGIGSRPSARVSIPIPIDARVTVDLALGCDVDLGRELAVDVGREPAVDVESYVRKRTTARCMWCA